MPRRNLTEVGTPGSIAEAAADGTIPIQIITPGWGSSGYYSAKVLEAAAKSRVWAAGTHMYLDHPTAQEAADRPARSVKDLTAVLVEDAVWNGKALIGKARPVPLGKTLLEDETFRSAVGVSVRASAIGDVGEAEGRKGWIVEELLPSVFNSVDVVTHAGRGGKVLEAVESAKAELHEAGELDSDRRDKFRNAVRDAYAEDGVDVWVEDYDDTVVYWDRWGGDDPGTFSQTYKETDDAVELTGDPVKVRVKRTYVPVDEAARTVELTREAALKAVAEARNVGMWMESRIHLGFTCTADEMFGDGRLTREERIALSAGIGAALDAFTASVEAAAPQLYERDLWATPEALAAVAEAATTVPVHPAGSNPTKEHTMPEIEESRLRELEEAHGRVPTLESELATQTAAREVAEQRAHVAEASGYAREFGTRRVTEANSELARPIVDRIVAEAMQEIPLGEDNRLDTEAFGIRVDAARKAEETYLASIAENVGTVRGLGDNGKKSTVTEAQAGGTIANVFGVNTPKAG